MSDDNRTIHRERLVVGDQATHPRHGFATVTFVGTDYVGLRFEPDGSQALLKLDQCGLRPGWDESALERDEPEPRAPLPWPDSTFVLEDADTEHYLGAHWEPFHEDGMKAFLKRLPALLPEAAPLRGFSDTYRPVRQEPAEWPKGVHLVWPAQQSSTGLVVTVRVGEQGSMVMSLYPYVDLGVQHTLTMQRVRVWEDGLEAHIDALWGEAPVTFFDTAFVLNRAWYDADGEYDFLLAGIAYHAQPAEHSPVAHTPHPDVIAWQRLLAEEHGEPPPENPDVVDFRGAAIFMPIPEWDDDEYTFHGPVKEVEAFDDFLGQSGWKVRVTVMRFDDEDADLDIYVTRRAWAGDQPPEPGQDIEGELWLQGSLCLAPQAWEPGKRKL